MSRLPSRSAQDWTNSSTDMKYLLDTNAVIAVLNDPKSAVASKLKQKEPEEVGISTIVIHELYYGAFKSAKQKQNVDLVDNLLFEVLELDKEDSRRAGEIRAILAVAGQPIGPFDNLIAGQAVARGLVLVTNNLQEFQRVPNLQVEDWSVSE